MPQLHCYVPDEMALQLQRKAEQVHLSVSKYLAHLIQRDVEAQWPQGYFELFGSWEGEPLQRLEQGNYEVREALF